MASVSVTIDIDEMHVPKIDEAAVGRWIESRLNDARNRFIQRVSRGGGAGRIYRHGKRSQHHASAPGEYPATDSGRLVNSVHYEMRGPYSGALVSDVGYAGFLTEGTVRMAPRKMLADALHEVLESNPRKDLLARALTSE